MKSLLVIIGASILLAGCAGTKPPQVVTKTETKVIIPDRKMFYCKNFRHYPNPATLTDKQVAKVIIEMHKRNTECQKNINNLYFFLEDAKKKAEEKNEEK